MPVERLAKIGFTRAGEWVLDKTGKTAKAKIRHTISDGAILASRVIYCFVVDRRPMYFGVVDAPHGRAFVDRLRTYRTRSGSPRTGVNLAKLLEVGGSSGNSARIVAALQAGRTVEIWTLVPEPIEHHSGLAIDLVRGLEYPLISEFRTKWPAGWNRAG